MKPVLILAVVVCGFAGAAQPAWATLANFKSFKEAYPGKDAKAYSCKVCHTGMLGKADNLNAYGKALEASKGAGNAKALSKEDFRAVEKDDADGDGASNGDELKAGTDPADPKSAPAGAGKGGASSPPPPGSAAPAGDKPSGRLPDALDRLQAYLIELLVPTASADETKKTDAPAAAEKAEYVGMETCAACHTKQYQEFLHSTHARIAVPNVPGAQGCETCHGPGSLHVAAGGGRGVGGIKNPKKDPSTCFECHLDKKVEFRLPYHHPVMEGKMGCTDCHNPHGQDVRPWSATSLKDINEVCFKCHKEQRGPFVWEHEALREGCTTCHKVHGSINEKMLLVRDANLCLRCHSQVNFPTIGKSSHASRLNQGTCFSAGCHTAVHGSNFSDHLRY